jgi:ABC-type multidrug transport system fused ATPase/permease subunit
LALILQKAFKTIRPIFRERAKINAEVTGRLTESLGGVRVVKGYHAEESEAEGICGRRERLLNNVISSLTAQSLMTLSSTLVLGVVGGLIMYLGAHETPRPPEHRRLRRVHHAAGVHDRADRAAGLIGTQLTEALAGLDRTTEILASARRTPSRGAHASALGHRGDVEFEDVVFEYEPGKPVLHGISFESKPGTVTALVGSSARASRRSSRSSAASTRRQAGRC